MKLKNLKFEDRSTAPSVTCPVLGLLVVDRICWAGGPNRDDCQRIVAWVGTCLNRGVPVFVTSSN